MAASSRNFAGLLLPLNAMNTSHENLSFASNQTDFNKANFTNTSSFLKENPTAILSEVFQFKYWFIFFTAIGLMIIVVNTYIVSLFIRNKALRSDLNALSLTICDCIVGYVCLPIFITARMREEIYLSGKGDILDIEGTHHNSTLQILKLLNISMTLIGFCALVETANVTAITITRAIQLTFPFKFQRLLTRTKSIIILLVIWLLSATFACASLAIFAPLFTLSHVQGTKECNMLREILEDIEKTNEKYKYIDIFYWLLASLTIISGIFTALTFIAIYRWKKTRKISQTSLAQKQQKEENSRLAIMCSFMVIATVAWLATCVGLARSSQKQHFAGFYMGRFLFSVLNPILYTLCKREFKIALKQDIRKLGSSCRLTRGKMSGAFVIPKSGSYELRKTVNL